jgi:CobQ-like glutamine amidotransferase family enzyme
VSGDARVSADTGASGESAVRIILVYPSLLGTYGDRGNALVLRERCRWRGIASEVVVIPPGSTVPEHADLYLLGGAEDAMQQVAVELLRNQRALPRAVDRGSPVLAVCAGLQLLGTAFPGADGRPVPGLGLLDATSRRGVRRAVGHLRTAGCALPDVPDLLGYENHLGRTELGAACRPLAHVRQGVGNGDGGEGAVQGRIVGTYAHGPVLALNPALADTLLGWVTGPLAPVDDEPARRARADRAHRRVRTSRLLRR